MERKTWTKEECKALGMELIRLGDYIDKLYDEGRITKNRRGRMKTTLKYSWDIYYNKRPDIPEGIKQASNYLYSWRNKG